MAAAKTTAKKKTPTKLVRAEHSVKILTKGQYMDRYGERWTSGDIQFLKDGNMIIAGAACTKQAVKIPLSTLQKVMAELEKKVEIK